MNPSVDKRKMPRMQVDLPACIIWGVSNTAANISINNLSIHGLAFQSKRYFSEGTSLRLTFPQQKAELKEKKIRAVVVRCEALNGVSSGNFRIGAKFLFESKFFARPKKNPSQGEHSSALQPLHSQSSAETIHKRRAIGLSAQTDNASPLNSPACTIRVGELKAQFVQVIQTTQKQETIHTFFKIEESRWSSINASPLSKAITPGKVGVNEGIFGKPPWPGKTLTK